ncbi:SRPBCC family protein [Pusillimonas sp. (ex Stolz et al. 2005)]|uniref:SRPBCC family protein n=1 Tax=Pusillimonas sp. (ex Stolz et al. 2005) TaxID=1979962 RepID=UPI00262DF19A|nr:SRPBCC family protein [Pusillimonas sp. (ex Stolz et al. 2005)]
MNINYVFTLDVAPDRAWAVLNDIPSITPCMPGASLDGQDDKGYKGKMKVKLGPIDMIFNGHIRFLERDDTQRRALLEAAANELKGAGNAKATIKFSVVPQGSGSEITVDSDYAVSGRAAQLGSGVIQSVGKRLMDEFAKRLSARIAAETQVASATEPAAVRPDPAPVRADNEALDLVGLTWKPVLARAAIIVMVAACIGYGIWRFVA